MATYPTVTTAYLPTVTGKVITSVDKNGLNPITNMIIKMLEKMRDNLDDTIASATSSYNITVPDSLINSEYDNKIYYSYGESEYPFYTNITGASVNNLFITNTSKLKYKSFNDGDVIRVYQESIDQGNAIFKPLYSGIKTPYNSNFTYQVSDITQYFAEPYSSAVNRTYAYRGEAGSRTQISSVNNLVLVLKFKGFWTTEIDGDGNYTGSKIFIEQENYLIASIYKLFNRIQNFYFNYMGDEEINLHLFDEPIVVLGSAPPNVVSAQMATEPRMLLQDKIKMFNVIGIPFTLDIDQIQNETFTDGYNPDYKYVENGVGQPTDVTGGGDGNGDNTSDDFESSNGYNPLYPTAKQWVMNATEVDLLQSYLWYPSVWQQIQELWGDAWGAIISIKYYPFNISAHHSGGVGERETIKIGNVVLNSAAPGLPESLEPTPVTGAPMSPSYNCRIDLGEYEFKEYYGTFMDYEPYTSISIFLPFIGWRDIGTAEVMGKKLKVYYIIDFNTGGCTAYLTINNGTNEFLYSTYSGTIGIDLPLQQSDYMDKVRNMGISLLSTGLSAMVQQNGVTSSSVTKGTGESNVKGVSESRHFSTNLQGKLYGSKHVGDTFSNTRRETTSSGETTTKSDPTLGIINGLSGVAHMGVSPVHTTTSGVLGPTDSLWLSRKPIIRIERPIKSEASSFEENQGRPANITKKLGDLTGYVECLNPVLNFHCDESERTKISALLQGGIYL